MIVLFALAASAGCEAGECPKEVRVILTAKTDLAVDELETELVAAAWSHNVAPSHASLCTSGTERISAYRWDLDGDGRYERKTEKASQRVRLASPGVHTVRVQVQDAEGDKAEAELKLEVLKDPDAATLLATIDFELVPDLASDLSGCITRLCVEARTRLDALEVDGVRVLESASQRVLLERATTVLTQAMSPLGCEEFDRSMSPSVPIETVFSLDSGTRSSLEDWGRGIGCE